ncbi:MAG: amidohydrolase family protein [Eubacteriales bacterium]|nr:amidohydrolase family protein [Eubacteriales bacterium]
MNTFALKGNICFSTDREHLSFFPHSYVICDNGVCAGVYQKFPDKYIGIPCIDYKDCLVLPGFTDLHVHASQYAFRGLGMDLELIDWLNTRTFPEEQKYEDLSYARRAYEIFVHDLLEGATTRACIFSTVHEESTLLLMELLEQAGFHAYVGKVSMDRNCPEHLCEKGAEAAVQAAEHWIRACADRFHNIKPILTPRFIPSCTDNLMRGIAFLREKYHLSLQSHLSENLGEIAWVKELCPDVGGYGEAYEKFGVLEGDRPVIMAHCVHSTPEEAELLKRRGVFVAHCPQSNTNLASGIAPVRKYLDMGIHVGLGSDIAAGHSLSMFRIMAEAIQCSKLRWRLSDQSLEPLRVEEAFYLATRGGGAFFGKVGSFEKGFAFDAVVADDSALRCPCHLTLRERLERLIYLADDRHVAAKYIVGRAVKGQAEGLPLRKNTLA